MKIVFFTLLALLFSCSMETKSTALKNKFAKLITERNPALKNGNQLLFIVNKPECSPCIEAIEETVAAKYNAGKSIIHFGNAPFSIPGNVTVIHEDESTIAKYGMLGVDGMICVFSKGELILSMSFDTKNPQKAITTIQKELEAINTNKFRTVQ